MSSDARFELRLPPELRSKVDAAAQASGCTTTAEIVNRLWFTFAIEQPGNIRVLDSTAYPTLRDQFAMSALTGMIANRILQPMAAGPAEKHYAEAAYTLADAMLAARAKEPVNG